MAAAKKRITVAFVMGHDPCWADARERLPRLLGKRGLPLRACLDVLNSLTKYPSIPTYHVLGERGSMPGEYIRGFDGMDVIVTEKVDGTNARIVWLGDGDYLIGSREQWLHAKGDRVWVQDNGVVECLRGVVDRLPAALEPCVIYGEVYGGKINGAKNYTQTGQVGFRVFDVAKLDLGLTLHATLEQIATWREDGGPVWWQWRSVTDMCGVVGLSVVPAVAALAPLPISVAETREWLARHVGHNTLVALDGPGGQAEGVVVRTPGNQRRVKLRVEDYRRAAKKGGG